MSTLAWVTELNCILPRSIFASLRGLKRCCRENDNMVAKMDRIPALAHCQKRFSRGQPSMLFWTGNFASELSKSCRRPVRSENQRTCGSRKG